MVHRGSMDNRGSMIGRGSMDNGSLWVDSSSLIGNISNIAFIAISLVVDMLGTAIRESNRVRSLSIAGTITCLSSLEVGIGVVISYSVGVGVGGDLIRVGWLSMVGRGSVDNRGMVSRGGVDNRGVVDNRGMVSRGSMVDNRGMVSWGSMDNRGVVNNWGMVGRGSVVDNRGVISRGSVDKRGSMVSSTSNRSVSTKCWLDLRKSLRVVYLRDGGVGSSESF